MPPSRPEPDDNLSVQPWFKAQFFSSDCRARDHDACSSERYRCHCGCHYNGKLS